MAGEEAKMRMKKKEGRNREGDAERTVAFAKSLLAAELELANLDRRYVPEGPEDETPKRYIQRILSNG